MGVFATAARLASWAKICPGTNESAGKRRRGRTGAVQPVAARDAGRVRLGGRA
ncbi:MAG: transposase [Egibacteraceae bacterium]